MRSLIFFGCMVCLLLANACTSYPDTPVTTEMTSDGFLQEFVKKKCAFPSGALMQMNDGQRHACSEKWGLVFAEKLHARYPFADLQWVSERCNASPLACEPGHMESWAQDSDSDRRSQRMPASVEASPTTQLSCTNLSTPCD